MSCWVAGVGEDHPFGLHNLPYGVAAGASAGVAVGGGGAPRPAGIVCRIGDLALPLGPAGARLLPELADELGAPNLNPLLARDAGSWRRLRAAIQAWLSEERYRSAIEPLLQPVDGLVLILPFEVADYVDFYASEHHAANLGRIFRPSSPALPEAWKHLPIGYHGRSGTVVVSGTDVSRPFGLRRTGQGTVEDGPSLRLDFEAEVGFVLGAPSRLGEPVPLAAAGEHLFGVCLVNDWSARDLQAFEYVPLGPFLGKSFATSISPWVVPIEALASARVAPPPRTERLAGYLDDTGLGPWGLDIELAVELNGTTVSRPPFRELYWTGPQMLAHLSANGASVRAGDLFASGTVSGPGAGQQGSLIELSDGGRSPIALSDGTERRFLEDGDVVAISGRVPKAPGRPECSLGEVVGRVVGKQMRARTSASRG